MQRFRLLLFTFLLPLAACSTPGSNHHIQTRSYDIRDLVEREPGEFGLNAVLGKRSSGGNGYNPIEPQPEFVHRLIERGVKPSTGPWNAGPETLDVRDGTLTVHTTPAIHQEIECWLAHSRQELARPRTESWTGPSTLSEEFEYRIGP